MVKDKEPSPHDEVLGSGMDQPPAVDVDQFALFEVSADGALIGGGAALDGSDVFIEQQTSYATGAHNAVVNDEPEDKAETWLRVQDDFEGMARTVMGQVQRRYLTEAIEPRLRQWESLMVELSHALPYQITYTAQTGVLELGWLFNRRLEQKDRWDRPEDQYKVTTSFGLPMNDKQAGWGQAEEIRQAMGYVAGSDKSLVLGAGVAPQFTHLDVQPAHGFGLFHTFDRNALISAITGQAQIFMTEARVYYRDPSQHNPYRSDWTSDSATDRNQFLAHAEKHRLVDEALYFLEQMSSHVDDQEAQDELSYQAKVAYDQGHRTRESCEAYFAERFITSWSPEDKSDDLNKVTDILLDDQIFSPRPNGRTSVVVKK